MNNLTFIWTYDTELFSTVKLLIFQCQINRGLDNYNCKMSANFKIKVFFDEKYDQYWTNLDFWVCIISRSGYVNSEYDTVCVTDLGKLNLPNVVRF